MIYAARKRIINLGKKFLERQARKRIMSNKGLYTMLQTYMAQTKSTGCQYKDYDVLYRYVRKWKPQEILECGTGTSTVVLAYALMENEKEDGKVGRITSMEEVQGWFDMAKDLMPDILRKYVDIRLSPTVEDGYMFYRGMRYSEVPDRQYDFVFTDGPSTTAPSDGTRTFDFDFLHILRHSETPVGGVVDGRLTTCYVLQNVLGPKKFKFDVYRNLAYIKPCTKHDLNVITKSSSIALAHSKRIMKNTRFYVKMEPPQQFSEVGTKKT